MAGWREVARLAALPRAERELLVAAWLLSAPMWAALRVAGFDRTTRALGKLVPARSAAAPVDVEQGERLVRAAFRVGPARWATTDGGCLPRALLQYALHTRRGERVRFVVGVPLARGAAGAPFEAHAWVEAPGAPRFRATHAEIFAMVAP